MLSEGRLTFDSIYRFKGQEAAAVLADVDSDLRPVRTLDGAHGAPYAPHDAGDGAAGDAGQ